MAKVQRNYRLSQATLDKITELNAESGKTATDLIEAAIGYVHQEYIRALQGKNSDSFMLAQVLGKRIDKVS